MRKEKNVLRVSLCWFSSALSEVKQGKKRQLSPMDLLSNAREVDQGGGKWHLSEARAPTLSPACCCCFI